MCIRDRFDIEGVLKEGRHQQNHKGEDAQHHVLVMADKRRAHKRDAVSYTHLDVYKRQAQKCLNLYLSPIETRR